MSFRKALGTDTHRVVAVESAAIVPEPAAGSFVPQPVAEVIAWMMTMKPMLHAGSPDVSRPLRRETSEVAGTNQWIAGPVTTAE